MHRMKGSRWAWIPGLMCLLVFTAVTGLAAAEDRYLVGIGSGLAGDVGFRTEIQLINPGPGDSSGRIDFFNPDNEPKAVDLQPTWIGPEGTVSVEEGGAGFRVPAGSILILMLSPKGPGELGWARLQCPAGLGVRSELQVARFTREAMRRPGGRAFEDCIEHISEVEPVLAGKRFMFPIWYWAGHRQARTAVSVVNLSGAAADIQFVFRSGSDEQALVKTITLRPGEFLADYFDRIWELAFPLIFPHQMRASAEIVSSGEIAASVFNTLQELPVVAVKAFPVETATETVEAVLGQEVELRVDQVAEYAAEGLSVRFWDIPVDSRCPIDVVCVWQGEAIAAFRLTLPDGTVQDLRLHHEGESRAARIAGFRFEVRSLEPAPESTRALRVTDYRVRLLVDRDQ